MKKIFLFILLISTGTLSYSQTTSEAADFWNRLQNLCGKAFEGVLELPETDAQFGGKKLVMHVRSCTDTLIKIPFFVGDDKSRTWGLRFENDRITLYHDHRHEDGTPDGITMYGGTATNSGREGIQVFPANEATRQLIPAASANIWWITIDDTIFTYNLRRLDSPRVFRIVMDLTTPVELPDAPWGWKEE